MVSSPIDAPPDPILQPLWLTFSLWICLVQSHLHLWTRKCILMCDFSFFQGGCKFKPKVSKQFMQFSIFNMVILRLSELHMFEHRQYSSCYSLGCNISYSTHWAPWEAVLQSSANMGSPHLLWDWMFTCAWPKAFCLYFHNFMIIIVMCRHVCIPIQTVSFLMGVEGRGWFLTHFSFFRGHCGFLHI